MELMIKPIEFPVSLNAQINSAIQAFVNRMSHKNQSSGYYTSARNARNPLDDIALGKKAEFIVAAYLAHKRGYPPVQPDLRIRHGAGKGWDYDLPYIGFPSYHVKACNQGTYGYCQDYSWTFQWGNKSGTGGRDRLFSSSDDSMTACVYMIDHRSSVGHIKVILPTKDILPLLRDPLSPKLKGLKKCLYFRDLRTSTQVISEPSAASIVDSLMSSILD